MQGTFIYSDLTARLRENEPCVLATIMATRGSTPRAPGTSAIIRDGRLLTGTVGGGLAEYKLLQESVILKPDEQAAILQVDLSGKIIRAEDAICGGDMTLLIDARPVENIAAFQKVSEEMGHRRPGVLLTLAEFPANGTSRISRHWFSDFQLEGFPLTAGEEVKFQCLDMLQNNIPGEFRNIPVAGYGYGQAFVLLESIAPPPLLFIAGAGHIGKAMVHLGKMLGFEVTVWDYRPEFADPAQLPDANHVLCCQAEEIPVYLTAGKDTWVIIVTHGHRYDGDVLKNFIGSDAAYIGMIGSKAKVRQMRDHFISKGWATPEQWDRVYSPIGLGIGAKTVEEIAVAIAAQLIRVKYRKEEYHV